MIGVDFRKKLHEEPIHLSRSLKRECVVNLRQSSNRNRTSQVVLIYVETNRFHYGIERGVYYGEI